MKKYKHRLTQKVAKLAKSREHYKVGKFRLPVEIVEDSLDWELVLKGFKVLSFESLSGAVERVQKNGRFFLQGSEHKFDPFSYFNGLGFSSYVDDPEYFIKSVMMLEDGEIFSVGQRVAEGVISKFEIIDGKLEIIVEK